MNKILGFSLAASVLAIVITRALAGSDEVRPTGVPEKAWISMGTDAGFVITGYDSHAAQGAEGPMISGYFVARRSGHWIRLALNTEARAWPGG